MKTSLKFGEKKIGKDQPVIIIAEIGVNHEGSYETCVEMVKQAAKAGADSIKLQTIDADENYVEGTLSYNLFKTCELTRDETARIFDLSRKLGMEPFTTAGDLKTIDWVDQLNPAAHKISSGLLNSHRIIKYIMTKKRTMLLSTGMAGDEDISDVIKILKNENFSDFALFQCISRYPTPLNEVNLQAIKTLEKQYDILVGYSDHSLGVEACTHAVAAGAVILEKHFTLDKTRKSFDHSISLNSEEFAHLVKEVRKSEEMMGTGKKILQEEVVKVRALFDRCLVARKEIAKGELFTEDNVAIKRPLPERRGLSPKKFDNILGKKANTTLKRNDPITEDCL